MRLNLRESSETTSMSKEQTAVQKFSRTGQQIWWLQSRNFLTTVSLPLSSLKPCTHSPSVSHRLTHTHTHTHTCACTRAHTHSLAHKPLILEDILQSFLFTPPPPYRHLNVQNLCRVNFTLILSDITKQLFYVIIMRANTKYTTKYFFETET